MQQEGNVSSGKAGRQGGARMLRRALFAAVAALALVPARAESPDFRHRPLLAGKASLTEPGFVVRVWAENVYLSPTGALRTVYETECRHVRTSIGRFASIHHKCQDVLMKSGIEVDGPSFIWYAPYFGYSDFASVFWKTNRIVVVTVRQKDCCVRMYPMSQEMSVVRKQLEKRLEDYQFVCPLGGDGNVSEIGALSKGSAMKFFSLQTGGHFRMNKRKLFCGTRESVAAYECMLKIDNYLRNLKQKRCVIETYIALDGGSCL